MFDKEFELKSEKHSFINQVSNDSKYFNSKDIYFKLFMYKFDTQVSDSNVELFLKYKIPHCREIEDKCLPILSSLEINNKFIDKINKMVKDKVIVYEVVGEDTKFSVDLLCELVGFTKTINNTLDFGRPRLMFLNKFFEVGTEFRLKDGEIWTKDKNNFGFKFKDGKEVGTLNWVNLD